MEVFDHGKIGMVCYDVMRNERCALFFLSRGFLQFNIDNGNGT